MLFYKIPIGFIIKFACFDSIFQIKNSNVFNLNEVSK